MERINLYTTENYKKFNAIRKAGWDVKTEGRNLILIDKNNKADQYFNNYFRDINEVCSVLAGDLLRVGYLVTA